MRNEGSSRILNRDINEKTFSMPNDEGFLWLSHRSYMRFEERAAGADEK